MTASAMGWSVVARALPGEWTLVAPDLRGRGRSADVPGPYGLDRHPDDICTLVRGRGDKVVLVGHSLSAYAGLLAAAARPDLFSRLVLIDGGLSISLPAELDPDTVLDATLGPWIERLRRTYSSEEEYLEVFRTHPALAETWGPDLETYARYDMRAGPGRCGLRRCRGRAPGWAGGPHPRRRPRAGLGDAGRPDAARAGAQGDVGAAAGAHAGTGSCRCTPAATGHPRGDDRRSQPLHTATRPAIPDNRRAPDQRPHKLALTSRDELPPLRPTLHSDGSADTVCAPFYPRVVDNHSLDTASFSWPNINDGVSGVVTASSAAVASWRSLALRGCPVQETCRVDA